MHQPALSLAAWPGPSSHFRAPGPLLRWPPGWWWCGGATGPLFHFSATWQLVINNGTTIITFLVVFLIQRAQNKDSRVLHLKLNELIAATNGASNRLINAQDFSEEEIQVLHDFYCALAALAKKDNDLGRTRSVEEAEDNLSEKLAAHME